VPRLSVVDSQRGANRLRIVINLGLKDLLFLTVLWLIFGLIILSVVYGKNREKSQSSNPATQTNGNESSPS
jgi:hypothetical protein